MKLLNLNTLIINHLLTPKNDKIHHFSKLLRKNPFLNINRSRRSRRKTANLRS